MLAMYHSFRRAITPASFETAVVSRSKPTRQFELELGAPCGSKESKYMHY